MTIATRKIKIDLVSSDDWLGWIGFGLDLACNEGGVFIWEIKGIFCIFESVYIVFFVKRPATTDCAPCSTKAPSSLSKKRTDFCSVLVWPVLAVVRERRVVG